MENPTVKWVVIWKDTIENKIYHTKIDIGMSKNVVKFLWGNLKEDNTWHFTNNGRKLLYLFRIKQKHND